MEGLYQSIYSDQNQSPQGEVITEQQNHITFLHYALPYLLLKDSIKYRDIDLLQYVMNTCCIMFQGAAGHYKYAQELLYFVYIMSTNAATLKLQRAVLSNSLINSCRH